MYKALLHATEISGSSPDGDFEVFNIPTGTRLSKPASWQRTWRDFDTIVHNLHGGDDASLDVRKATQ